MPDSETPDLRSEAESLIGWWRDAGVDVLIDEEPRDWLAETKPVAKPFASHSAGANTGALDGKNRVSFPANPAAARAQAVLPKIWPTTLAEFSNWLASDTKTLSDYSVRQRLAPEGDPANFPMIVTDIPERGDAHAGHLLSGEIGDLFDKMIAAWKIDRSGIYLTAMAPARPASGRIDTAALELLGPILNRHIALVAPKKLWLLGEAASRAVLGMNVSDAMGRLHFVNYDGVTVEAIATLHPRVLVANPKSKGQVWTDMQKLIGNGPL